MSDSVWPHSRVAISFSNAWKWKVKVKSSPTLLDPMDCSPSGSSIRGISRQEYWSGVPLPSPPTGVKWYLILILIYIYMMISDVKHLFIYFRLFVCFLGKSVYSDPPPLVNWNFWFLLSFVSFLYISGINLYQKDVLQEKIFLFVGFLVFFLHCWLFLYFLCRSFLVWYCLTCLFLICCLVSYKKKCIIIKTKVKAQGPFQNPPVGLRSVHVISQCMSWQESSQVP